ncbi:MAG: InlB B-repeat-containing protein, partial [Oscillospiraceae bacterium]|nr:InlB B-repeat-containing protein [Oscillospiraceae bacterium]
ANEGLDYHHDFAAYPGYLPEGSRTIPAYAPAGRLSSTWYKSTEDMIGASEDHPPASYMYPDYDAADNDNLSNMNGTVNTGLLTYDIIKGERTYQYFKGTPLFAFGYGLTYTTFAYSDVTVSAVADGTFTVSGKVTNTGGVTSDEVVQVYSSFAGTPSRIQQPAKRLIAYDRLPAIEPDETRDFSFDVELEDKMGVWDVESGQFIVELGSYTIVAGSGSAVSAATGNNTTLNVTEANGGTAAPARDLTELTLAENFDDYLIYNPGSGTLGVVDTVEFISSSVDYDSNTAVQFRRDGTWLAFKDVTFASVPAVLTVRAGAEKSGALTVYAVPAGTAFDTATAVAAFALTDTRPTGSTYGEAGIGPAGVYPGTPAGQETQSRYLRPELRTAAVSAANLSANTAYDIYVVAEKRGTALEWLKFGAATDNDTAGVAISQVYSQDSIREQGGALALRADLTPVTSTQPVTWTVASTGGTPTALATIDPATGVLTAAGNGTVRVTAVSGTQTAAKDIFITNQLDANKVTFDINANPFGPPEFVPITRTVDYMLIRSPSVMSFAWGDFVFSFSTYWGASDSISRYQGTLQQVIMFKELFNETDAKYVATDSYLTLPGDAVTWSVANRAGTGPTLAAIDAAGLLTATGEGDGDVVVRAVLKSNPDIVSERVIRLQNQSPKDAFKIIEAENWDTASAGSDTTGSAYVAGGNEIGVYQTFAATRPTYPPPADTDPTPPAVLSYKNVDFGAGAGIFQLRLAAVAAATVELWIDAADTAGGGTQIGTLAVTPTGGDNYADYQNLTAYVTKTTGVKDLYLKVLPATPTDTVTLRLSRFQFAAADTQTVSFDAQGGELQPAPQVFPPAGGSATEPTAPTRAYATFNGWYTAATSGTQWNFATPITSSLTLYAQWTETRYTVTFETDGGDQIQSQQILHGAPVADPGVPARQGYTFSGWYTTATGGSRWDFDNPITSNLALYAHWTVISSSTYDPTKPPTTPSTPRTPDAPDDTSDTPDAPSGPLASFPDAGQVSGWATEFVERLVEAEIISGRSNGTIDPKGNVTRAELTKMIVLGLGLEAGEAPKSFADVTAGDWFKSVVDTASSHGIVLGVSETAFAPNRTITRQDLCTIVYRGLVALDVTLPELADGSAFPDEAQIASYALDAVKTLNQLNIVTGRSSGVFDPQAYATREETAKIICGVIDYIASASAPASTESDSTEPASTESDSTAEPTT